MKTIELNSIYQRLKGRNFGDIPEDFNEDIVRLAAPHIDSFNYFLEEGLQNAIRSIGRFEFALATGDRITLSIQDIEVGKPRISDHLGESASVNLYPKECIEAGSTYKGALTGTVVWQVNQSKEGCVSCPFGEIPIMVKSKKCHLYGMSPKNLVKHGEIVNETGGYFIVNGNCRVLRLLTANRRNHPIVINRKSWKLRDDNTTGKGILIRCVSDDETTCTNILHHLTTGGVQLEIRVKNELFLIPLMIALRVLLDYSDKFIFLSLIRGREDDKYFSEKIKMMLREMQDKNLLTQKLCKDYIGMSFRIKLHDIPIWLSNEEVCDILFSKHVLIYLNSAKLKFDTLCMMTRKLFAFIGGDCNADSVDVVSMQEATLGGHTYLQLVKEKLIGFLNHVKLNLMMKARECGDLFVPSEVEIRSAAYKNLKFEHTIQTFIATGSLPSRINCGLMQTTGLTVMLEHLNRLRDLSHFRAIHRGSFFMDMKTIGPRRLTGEAWGFICPVHTPDGAPCGLLNHLAFNCEITSEHSKTSSLIQPLIELGMMAADGDAFVPYNKCLEVILDGGLVGYVPKDTAKQFVRNLRALKVEGKVYMYTEIALIEAGNCGGQYPALYIITSHARMMRPVLNLSLGATEFIGTFEQLFLNVAISPEDIEEGVHTHMDLSKTSMLSNTAKLVPFSDCNPNPRNMYQCQMGKQTMGTPIHNWKNQTSSKLYRLQYPQIPLVRNSHYDNMNMEEFCMGFNAVLAIVSYTGYDMEDAMVINKCAMERGLAHGQVYKSEFIDLANKKSSNMRQVAQIFRRKPNDKLLANFLDDLGLPPPGTKLSEGDPYFCTYDLEKDSYHVVKYRGEDCVVDKYSLINSSNPKCQTLQKVNITIRIRRDPIIGDKFASRSGQKGVMSRLYPMEDLPFSERGISPDIIFNPHGIPSRMTAGTLIDLVAGKCAAEFGVGFDSTPFEFDDENPAFDYFGKILEKAGFNYYGEDVLYSGIDGRMMEVEIFEGIVYYQRLRHMTADKWQVRSTGPMDNVTRQPIKGRKKGGAIRFGEMERDCLIAHGAAYTLKDRLLDCSDNSLEWVCSRCGSVLSPLCNTTTYKHSVISPECSVCGPEAEVRQIQMPYAFKFLIAELASVGIKTDLGVKSADEITKGLTYPAVQTEK